jgi:hypothetical protein
LVIGVNCVRDVGEEGIKDAIAAKGEFQGRRGSARGSSGQLRFWRSGQVALEGFWWDEVLEQS